jgi:hypothetical protein
MREQLDSMAFKACGPMGWRACKATTLYCKLQHFPSAEILVAVIRQWMGFWSGLQKAERLRVNTTWQKLKGAMIRLGSQRCWLKASCPLTATIATVLTAGWHPVGPACWLNGDKSLKAVLAQSSGHDGMILREFRKSLEAEYWICAASHYGGEGLERGRPSFEALSRVNKVFRKEGKPDLAHRAFKLTCGGGFCARQNTTECMLSVWPRATFWRTQVLSVPSIAVR